MNILVTLDRNYLPPLRVMLGSLLRNDPGETFEIYAIGDGLLPEDWAALEELCAGRGRIHPLEVPADLFADAPVARYWTRAMYYRLLAGITDPVNRLRLENYEAEAYYNSGVLVMDLSAMRREVRPGDIFDYAREHADILLLPDQDVLNGLYGGQILGVDDSLWNYDARRFDRYLLLSQGERDMDWVMDHTAILHFCGKRKPWNHSYQGRFSALYKHYQRLVERR